MEKCNDCKKMVKEAPFGQCDDCFEQSMKSDGSVIYSLSEEDRKEKRDDWNIIIFIRIYSFCRGCVLLHYGGWIDVVSLYKRLFRGIR